MTIASEINPSLFLNDNLDQSDLNASRMCISGMTVVEFMKEHRGIQLTKSGSFSRKFVAWAVEEFQWPTYKPEELYAINKVLNEDDVPWECVSWGAGRCFKFLPLTALPSHSGHLGTAASPVARDFRNRRLKHLRSD